MSAACGIFAAAALTAARAALLTGRPFDGIAEELDACARLNKSADAYYAMVGTSAEEAAIGTRATRAIADAWDAKFGLARAAPFEVPLLAFVGGATCALAWELAGHSTLAPAIALVVASADAHLLRPDTERTRVTLDGADMETRGQQRE